MMVRAGLALPWVGSTLPGPAVPNLAAVKLGVLVGPGSFVVGMARRAAKA